MNRAERRRFEKEFATILRNDGDHCTLCRRELQHNERTFGGKTGAGTVALTTECCRSQLVVEAMTGLYTNRFPEAMPAISGKRRSKVAPQGELTNALDALQSHFSAIDDIATDARKRAGVRGTGAVNLQASAWKADDAAWFASHPDRSHRLRPMADDEAATYPPGLVDQPMPENHRFEVVIRQIEPGRRVRLPFGRNVSVPIPDHEAIIHALFDRIAAGGGPGRVVSVREIAEVAKLHEGSGQTPRN